MNALESKVPLVSNCARATPARPHSSGYNEDVNAKAPNKKKRLIILKH